MKEERPDPGLQSERTELAWRRTTLALAVGSLIALRVLPPALGVLGISGGLLGLGFSGVLRLFSGRRSRELDRALSDPSRLLPDGRLLLALSCGVLVLALLGMLYVVRQIEVRG